MADELEIKVAELGQQMKVANHRIEDLENKTDRIESLTLSVQKLAISVENMAKEQIDYRAKQEELANRVLSVEQKPNRDKANKWEKVVETLFTLVFGALVSYLLYNIFGL